jgi:hypothetical protein
MSNKCAKCDKTIKYEIICPVCKIKYCRPCVVANIGSNCCEWDPEIYFKNLTKRDINEKYKPYMMEKLFKIEYDTSTHTNIHAKNCDVQFKIDKLENKLSIKLADFKKLPEVVEMKSTIDKYLEEIDDYEKLISLIGPMIDELTLKREFIINTLTEEIQALEREKYRLDEIKDDFKRRNSTDPINIYIKYKAGEYPDSQYKEIMYNAFVLNLFKTKEAKICEQPSSDERDVELKANRKIYAPYM